MENSSGSGPEFPVGDARHLEGVRLPRARPAGLTCVAVAQDTLASRSEDVRCVDPSSVLGAVPVSSEARECDPGLAGAASAVCLSVHAVKRVVAEPAGLLSGTAGSSDASRSRLIINRPWRRSPLRRLSIRRSASGGGLLTTSRTASNGAVACRPGRPVFRGSCESICQEYFLKCIHHQKPRRGRELYSRNCPATERLRLRNAQSSRVR